MSKTPDATQSRIHDLLSTAINAAVNEEGDVDIPLAIETFLRAIPKSPDCTVCLIDVVQLAGEIADARNG